MRSWPETGLVAGLTAAVLLAPSGLRAQVLPFHTGTAITTGGIMGTVVALRGNKLQLRIAENVKIDVSRNAVASMQEPEQE